MRRLIAFLILLMAAGCMPRTVYLNSMTDPAYQVSRADTIFLFVPNDAPMEDRQFAGALRAEMVAAGFHLTDTPRDARYVLMLRTGERSSTINSTMLLPTTQTTTGQVGGTNYSANTNTLTAVPITRRINTKGFALELYAMADVMQNTIRTVWEGRVGADAGDYAQYQRQIIRMLLDVVGTNYQGHTPIQGAPPR